MNLTARTAILCLLSLASSPVLAHPGDHAGGFAHGFAHPLLGPDHLLAMVVVGLWAVRGARPFWLLPAVFVTFMAVGAALGDLRLPFVEPMTLLSVPVFALAAVGAKRLPLAVGSAVVAVFALYHGHAHFTEMPDTSAAGFLAGMLLATALLHLSGAGIALLARLVRPGATRKAA
jgi:urease accessory protein